MVLSREDKRFYKWFCFFMVPSFITGILVTVLVFHFVVPIFSKPEIIPVPSISDCRESMILSESIHSISDLCKEFGRPGYETNHDRIYCDGIPIEMVFADYKAQLITDSQNEKICTTPSSTKESSSTKEECEKDPDHCTYAEINTKAIKVNETDKEITPMVVMDKNGWTIITMEDFNREDNDSLGEGWSENERNLDYHNEVFILNKSAVFRNVNSGSEPNAYLEVLKEVNGDFSLQFKMKGSGSNLFKIGLNNIDGSTIGFSLDKYGGVYKINDIPYSAISESDAIEMTFNQNQSCEFKIDNQTKWSGGCTVPSVTQIKNIFFEHKDGEGDNKINDIILSTNGKIWEVK